MSEPKPHVPRAFELEDYLAGELDPAQAKAIEMASEHNSELSNWLARRQSEREAFFQDPRRRSFASLLAEATQQRSPSRWAPWFAVRYGKTKAVLRTTGLTFGLVAGVTAMAMVIPTRPEVRTKGGFSVRAAVLVDGSAHILTSGEPLVPRSRLRLTIEDPVGGYLTVLLEERNGTVNLLYAPEELGELSPGTHLLPGSLELDERLGRERLYIIMSDDLPPVAQWRSELERGRQRSGFEHGWLPPAGSRFFTIEYDKVEDDKVEQP